MTKGTSPHEEAKIKSPSKAKRSKNKSKNPRQQQQMFRFRTSRSDSHLMGMGSELSAVPSLVTNSLPILVPRQAPMLRDNDAYAAQNVLGFWTTVVPVSPGLPSLPAVTPLIHPLHLQGIPPIVTTHTLPAQHSESSLLSASLPQYPVYTTKAPLLSPAPEGTPAVVNGRAEEPDAEPPDPVREPPRRHAK
eukprot:TRINITY_DN2255_c0_g1_i2.p1 TRINITY_DN2255_c0_g1~~TRINITY_DN2255_c0_g1_i2.p1  ORF type:complete len:191 (+),score=3.76 TRINITY_DN2255_c0_g1_i2:246-818(+)